MVATPHTMTYQQPASRLAPGRTQPDSFDQGIATIARALRLDVGVDLTDYERGLCEDYGRGASRDGEARYRMVTFRSLCAIARRSRRPELREALAELVRAEILDGAAPTDVEVAFDAECGATGPCDVEQRQYEKNPNPITWKRCRDALARQLAVTRVALDAVLSVRTWT